MLPIEDSLELLLVVELALESCDAWERHDERESSRFSLPASVAGLLPLLLLGTTNVSQEDDRRMTLGSEGREDKTPVMSAPVSVV